MKSMKRSLRIATDKTNAFVALAMIGTSALMFWGALKVISDTESPIVVVLTGSMEPGFLRGDLLFLHRPKEQMSPRCPQYAIGDIVVYKLPNQSIPIVHRVHQIHHDADGHPKYLTKGDNNALADTLLYQSSVRGMEYLEGSDIVGRVVGYFPKLGYATIALKDSSLLKYGMFVALGIMALTGND